MRQAIGILACTALGLRSCGAIAAVVGSCAQNTSGHWLFTAGAKLPDAVAWVDYRDGDSMPSGFASLSVSTNAKYPDNV